jgi:hypothetical protein
VARARTFGFMRDVELLWKNGFALGASLDNTVAIGEECVINPEGLRYDDEFVRHKLLDAVGDVAHGRIADQSVCFAPIAAVIASTSLFCANCSPIRRISRSSKPRMWCRPAASRCRLRPTHLRWAKAGQRALLPFCCCTLPAGLEFDTGPMLEAFQGTVHWIVLL